MTTEVTHPLDSYYTLTYRAADFNESRLTVRYVDQIFKVCGFIRATFYAYRNSVTYTESVKELDARIDKACSTLTDLIRKIGFWILEQIEELGGSVPIRKLVEFTELTEEMHLEFAMDLFSWE